MSYKSYLFLLCVQDPESTFKQSEAAINSLLNESRSHIEQNGIQFEVLKKVGKPAFVICDIADELDVDLIVIGTQGVNLENETESTANRIIQLAPCPVLVIP